MRADHLSVLSRSPLLAASRRGLLAGLTGVVAGAVAASPQGADGKRKGKRKRKRKKRNKQDTPQTRTDAQCAAAGGSVQAVFSTPNGRVAQTFFAVRSGTLTRAEIQIENPPGFLGDFALQVAPTDAFGFPTNEVLASTFLPDGQAAEGFSTAVFTFPQPASVTAGVQYALVLSRPEVGVAWQARRDDGCAGRAFFSDDRTKPFQGAPLEFDLIFTTVVLS